MKTTATSERVLDAGSLGGIATGIALLLGAFLLPGLEVLAVPALLILVPSLLVGSR